MLVVLLGACGDSGILGVFPESGAHDAAPPSDARIEPPGDGDLSPSEAGTLDAAFDGGGCPSAQVRALRVRPTLWWVLDPADLDSVYRNRSTYIGDVVEALFFGEAGLFRTLEGYMHIGALSTPRGNGEAASCGTVVEVEPAALNAERLRDFYQVLRGFPDPQHIAHVPLKRLVDDHLRQATEGASPVFVIWMVPDMYTDDCEGVLDPPPWEPFPILNPPTAEEEWNHYDALLTRAVEYMAGYADKIFVVAQGDARAGSTGAERELPIDYVVDRNDALARIGGTEHAYGKDLLPETVGDLRDALLDELRPLISCEVTLNGEVVEGQECRGQVTVDGEPIPCNDPDGWRLKDPVTLELTGASCDALKADPDATVEADFPCDVFLI